MRKIKFTYIEKVTKLAKSPPCFVLCSVSQKLGGDFAKFCGLLGIYQLYSILSKACTLESARVEPAIKKLPKQKLLEWNLPEQNLPHQHLLEWNLTLKTYNCNKEPTKVELIIRAFF